MIENSKNKISKIQNYWKKKKKMHYPINCAVSLKQSMFLGKMYQETCGSGSELSFLPNVMLLARKKIGKVSFEK